MSNKEKLEKATEVALKDIIEEFSSLEVAHNLIDTFSSRSVLLITEKGVKFKVNIVVHNISS